MALSELFSWVLYFPFLIVFLTYINCIPQVQNALNLTCDSSFQRIAYLILASLGLILGVVIEWWLSLFFQND